MEKYIIQGGNRLFGEVNIQSAKNSVLCLLSAVVLCKDTVIIHKCPKIYDVKNMISILKSLGCNITWEGDSLICDPRGINLCKIDDGFTKSMRSSIFLLGPLIARLKEAEISYPGGCDIGLRPIDLHIKGLRELGVEIDDSGGVLKCRAERLQGSVIQLDYPSVGATENVIMAAVYAKGKTIIKNAAKEPEITDLQNFINAMGGSVYGAGSSTVVIEGGRELRGGEFTPIPDRIVAGTYLIAGAMTGGEITLNGCNEEHIYSLIVKLRESACKIMVESDKIHIRMLKRPKAVSIIETSPYPGFPTDLQAQILAMQTISDGTCILQENLFETRFKHVGELLKMGANITVKGRTAIIQGIPSLSAGKLIAHDLRGGAGLVLAGLVANGVTEIEDVHHIERGYVDIVGDLTGLGADIRKV